MIKPYAVTIIKTIRTTITIDAEFIGDARVKVEAYGITEAVSDFPSTNEDVEIRIGRIELIRR